MLYEIADSTLCDDRESTGVQDMLSCGGEITVALQVEVELYLRFADNAFVSFRQNNRKKILLFVE